MIKKGDKQYVHRKCKKVCWCDHTYKNTVKWSTFDLTKYFKGVSDTSQKMPNGGIGWWVCKSCGGIHYGLLHYARKYAENHEVLSYPGYKGGLQYPDSFKQYEETINAD